MPRKYDAVFLDAQGTILLPHPSLLGIYAAAFRAAGAEINKQEVALAIRSQWTELRAAQDGAAALDTSDEITKQWWADFNARLCRGLGIPSSRTRQVVGALWQAFGEPEHWRLFPEVRQVLDELQDRGYQLGVVSNWDSRLIPICQALGVTHYARFVLASAVVGMEKPDKRIFDLALANAEVAPSQAVHVGDDYEADVIGAQRAGIDAVLLDRDGSADGRHEPTIKNLTQLLTLLD